MYGLYSALSHMGHNVKILTLKNESNCDSVIEARRGRIKITANNILAKFTNRILPSIFSLSTFDLLREIEAFCPDVINFHWIHGYHKCIPIGLLKRLSSSSKIFWTLHDMWPLSGGCFYSYECQQWINGCKSCPQRKNLFLLNIDLSRLNWSIRKSVLSSCNIDLIMPSKWLYNLTERSAIFAKNEKHLIPYGVNTMIYKPSHGSVDTRVKLGIPQKSKVILYISKSLLNERKGIRYFIEAIEILNKKNPNLSKDISILMVGNNGLKLKSKLGIHTVIIDKVTDRLELSRIYNAADIYVIPTLADNLPSTVLESLSCGTPVVGFNTGGLPDMIIDGQTGLIARQKDSLDLAGKLEMLLQNDNLRSSMCEEARILILSKFNLKKQAEEYLRIFNI